MSTHGAFICKIQTRPHPNADRLMLGQVGGFQVVVSTETQDGDIGVFFSSELCLSKEYADANKVRKSDMDGGYFDDNLRVRAQNFRKEKSEGYYAPLSSLAFTGADLSKLKVGDVLEELNGIKLCEKYITPATRRAMARGQMRREIPSFPKHYDTNQLGTHGGLIPEGSLYWLTLKMHGTSQRTGRVWVEEEKKVFNWWRKLVRKPKKVVTSGYEYVSGTRNTVLGRREGEASKNFRFRAAELFEGKLNENEIIYYEIVGWEDDQTTIMGRHNFKSTKEYKSYGDGVVYSYGQPEGTFGVYVYRITHMSRDPYGMWIQTDLSWPQVKRRCSELGVVHTPEFVHEGVMSSSKSLPRVFESLDQLRDHVDSICDGPDPMDARHPREGVVIHFLTPEGRIYALKHKGMTFKVGEGIAKEKDDYVDAEEAA